MNQTYSSSTLLNASVLQIEVISMVYLCSGLLSGLPLIGPAFDTALEDIKVTYPYLNFTQRIVGNSALDCNVAKFLDDYDYIIADFYFNRNRNALSKQFDLTAFITPATPGDGTEVARLATEENKLLITSVAWNGVSPFFPSWITTTISSFPIYARVYENMARKFNWTDMAMVIDMRSDINPFYRVIADFIRKRLEISRTIRLTELRFDSGSYRASDYEQLLGNVSRISRVVLYFVGSSTLQDLQSTAARLNMTNGDYIFIGIVTFRFPSLTGDYRSTGRNSTNPKENSAFRSFILVESPPEQTENVTRLYSHWREMSRTRYNYTYKAVDPVSPYASATYAAMVALAEVTDDIRLHRPREQLLNSGRQLARMFANRTFALKTGKLRFNEDGESIPYVAITQTNPDTGQIKIIMEQDAETGQLEMINPVDWPSVWPVPNKPICGFQGDSIKCQKNDADRAVIYGASCGTVAIVILVSVFFGIYLKRLKYRDRYRDWWEMEGNPIMLMTRSTNGS